MSDLAGWVVQVAVERAGGGEPWVEHWYANIADRQGAAEAVRAAAGGAADTRVEPVAPLSKDIFAHLGIQGGSARQAVDD